MNGPSNKTHEESLALDLNQWIEKTTDLLKAEHDEEVKEATENTMKKSRKDIERKGTGIFNLKIDEMRTGLFGKEELCLVPRRLSQLGLVNSTKIRMGSVVSVSSVQKEKRVSLCTGTVTRINSTKIAVCLSSKGKRVTLC